MTTTLLHGGTAPLAALTTIFTPPCPSTYLITTSKPSSALPSFPTEGNPTCVPTQWTANIVGGGFQYYSPAICPRGFSVGESCSVTKFRTLEGFPASVPGETAAWCVPTGMTCSSDTSDFRGGVWGFIRSTSATGFMFTYGPAMQIRWQASDLANLATHPLTSGMVFASTTTAMPTVQPEATESAAILTTSTTVPETSTSTSMSRPTWTAASEAASDPPVPQSTLTSTSSEVSSADFETALISPTTSMSSSTSSASNAGSEQALQTTQTSELPGLGVGGSTAGGNSGLFMNQGAAIAIILTLGISLLLALGFLVAMITRRRRRGQLDKVPKPAFPVEYHGRARWYNIFWRGRQHQNPMPDAELGPSYYQELDAKERIPELRSDSSTLSTLETPAELDAVETYSGKRNSLRWMSRWLGRRSAPPAYTRRSRNSLGDKGDIEGDRSSILSNSYWEKFPQKLKALRVNVSLAIPETAYTRSSTVSMPVSGTNASRSGDRETVTDKPPVEIPRMSILGRLSTVFASTRDVQSKPHPLKSHPLR